MVTIDQEIELLQLLADDVPYLVQDDKLLITLDLPRQSSGPVARLRLVTAPSKPVEVSLESLEAPIYPPKTAESAESSLQAQAEALFAADEPSCGVLVLDADMQVISGQQPPPPPKGRITPPRYVQTYFFTTHEPYTIQRSKFQFFTCPIHSLDLSEFHKAMEDLCVQYPACAKATHNMAVCRVRGPDGQVHGFHKEDGEAGAGAPMLACVEQTRIVNRLVVVSRWFGGVLLGPKRFRIINHMARDGIVAMGDTIEKETTEGESTPATSASNNSTKQNRRHH